MVQHTKEDVGVRCQAICPTGTMLELGMKTLFLL